MGAKQTKIKPNGSGRSGSGDGSQWLSHSQRECMAIWHRHGVGELHVFIPFATVAVLQKGEEALAHIYFFFRSFAPSHPLPFAMMTQAVTDVYEIVEVIGQGHLGEVLKVHRKVEKRGMHNTSTRHLNGASRERTASMESPLRRVAKKVAKKNETEDSTLEDLHKDRLVEKRPNHREGLSPAPILRKSSHSRNASYSDSAPHSQVETESEHTSESDCGTYSLSSSRRKLKRHHSVHFQRLYACKAVSTNRIKKGQLEELLNEVQIMRTLDHPYILRLYEVYQVKRKLWLIMELCTGGDLTTRQLNECEVTVVMEQILRAVAYMHRRGFIHRNISLTNVLYEHSGTNATVRLIDFGLSQAFDRGEKRRKAVGTAYTLAPEMALGAGTYTEKTDIWSVGVVCWILLAGDFPFIREAGELKDKENLNRLINAQIRFGITWKGRGISMKAKDFVRGCLQRRPEDRWTAKEALDFLEKTWIPALEKKSSMAMNDRNGHDVAENNGSDDDAWSISDPDALKKKATSDVLEKTITIQRHKRTQSLDSVGVAMDDLQRFCRYGKMKKMMLMQMAETMDRIDVGRLREIFLAIDAEDTGTISFLELKEAFQGLKPTIDDKALETLFEGIDQDHSGQIHYAEFLAALVENQGLITMERLSEAFDRLDTEGKGYISHNDLKDVLGTEYDRELVDSMIREADFKKNGQVDYEELLQLMFEDPSAGMEAAGDVTESLRSLGL